MMRFMGRGTPAAGVLIVVAAGGTSAPGADEGNEGLEIVDHEVVREIAAARGRPEHVPYVVEEGLTGFAGWAPLWPAVQEHWVPVVREGGAPVPALEAIAEALREGVSLGGGSRDRIEIGSRSAAGVSAETRATAAGRLLPQRLARLDPERAQRRPRARADPDGQHDRRHGGKHEGPFRIGRHDLDYTFHEGHGDGGPERDAHRDLQERASYDRAHDAA
jgi:hypothetical protein